MKKTLIIITLIIASMFVTTPVEAAPFTKEQRSLNYDIESFRITNDSIIISGWSFIKYLHSNDGGNSTKITITAINNQNGNWKDFVVDDYGTYNGVKDEKIYYANCEKWAGEDAPCIEDYLQASCTEGKSGSSCRYNDIGFNIEIPLSELLALVDGNSQAIDLYMKTSVSNGGTMQAYFAERLAVSTPAIYDFNPEEGKTVNINNQNISINIDGITDKALITSSSTRVLKRDSTFLYHNNFYWIQWQSYEILGIEESIKDKTAGLKMYKLSFSKSGNNYAKPENPNEEGYAYATWLKVEGGVSITLDNPSYQTSNCPPEIDTYSSFPCDETTNSYKRIKNQSIEIKEKLDGDGEYDLYTTECTEYRSYIERIITTTASINQNGTMTIEKNPPAIYSGGGFSLSANYNSVTSYEFCNDFQTYTVQMKIVDHYCYITYPQDCNEEGICIPLGEEYNPGTAEEIYELTPDSKEWELVTQKVQSYIEEPNDNAKTYLPDSNSVSNYSKQITNEGTWNDTYSGDENGNPGNLDPQEKVTYEIGFVLNRACINRYDATITYRTTDCTENEINGDILYYIPLKQPNGNFPIKINIEDFNVLKNEKWTLNYECDIKCLQKLYDENDWSFAFIYRPINLNNPFPGDRARGANWEIIYQTDETIAKENIFKRNNLEYEINLGPSEINNIKNYNNNKTYTNLNDFYDSGRSGFLSERGITNLIDSNNFNKLGECTTDCWNSINMSGVGVY